jgi:hypothetical protein
MYSIKKYSFIEKVPIEIGEIIWTYVQNYIKFGLILTELKKKQNPKKIFLNLISSKEFENTARNTSYQQILKRLYLTEANLVNLDKEFGKLSKYKNSGNEDLKFLNMLDSEFFSILNEYVTEIKYYNNLIFSIACKITTTGGNYNLWENSLYSDFVKFNLTFTKTTSIHCFTFE